MVRLAMSTANQRARSAADVASAGRAWLILSGSGRTVMRDSRSTRKVVRGSCSAGQPAPAWCGLIAVTGLAGSCSVLRGCRRPGLVGSYDIDRVVLVRASSWGSGWTPLPCRGERVKRCAGGAGPSSQSTETGLGRHSRVIASRRPQGALRAARPWSSPDSCRSKADASDPTKPQVRRRVAETQSGVADVETSETVEVRLVDDVVHDLVLQRPATPM